MQTVGAPASGTTSPSTRATIPTGQGMEFICNGSTGSTQTLSATSTSPTKNWTCAPTARPSGTPRWRLASCGNVPTATFPSNTWLAPTASSGSAGWRRSSSATTRRSYCRRNCARRSSGGSRATYSSRGRRWGPTSASCCAPNGTAPWASGASSRSTRASACTPAPNFRGWISRASA